MSAAREVRMNIPEDNPLFGWVFDRALHSGAVEPLRLTVSTPDGIDGVLVLVEAPGVHGGSHQQTYLSTTWQLLRAHP